MWEMFVALVWLLVKWTAILAWRFFSGSHMDGDNRRNDSTWFKDASRKYQKVRRKYTWWNRKCRMKRAAWRNAIFWPCLVLSVGFAVDPWGMLFILGMLSPGLYFFGYRRWRLFFYIPIAGTESDGITRQYWTMKPEYRRILEKFKPDHKRRHPKYPGLLRDPEFRQPKSPRLEDIPPEFAGAVRSELAMDALEEPPIVLKLLLDPEVDMIE